MNVMVGPTRDSLAPSDIIADLRESMLDLGAGVGEGQSTLLCELVDDLAATRSEAGIRATIEAWKTRVDGAGYDASELLALFDRTRPVPRRCRGGSQRWADADKREFILVCIEVYSRPQQPESPMPDAKRKHPVAKPPGANDDTTAVHATPPAAPDDARGPTPPNPPRTTAVT
jgi:hypothetical protein